MCKLLICRPVNSLPGRSFLLLTSGLRDPPMNFPLGINCPNVFSHGIYLSERPGTLHLPPLHTRGLAVSHSCSKDNLVLRVNSPYMTAHRNPHKLCPLHAFPYFGQTLFLCLLRLLLRVSLEEDGLVLCDCPHPCLSNCHHAKVA